MTQFPSRRIYIIRAVAREDGEVIRGKWGRGMETFEQSEGDGNMRCILSTGQHLSSSENVLIQDFLLRFTEVYISKGERKE